jgi:hypothetical protein
MLKYILTFLWEFIMDKKNGESTAPGVGKKLFLFVVIAVSFAINYVAINRLYVVSKAHIELGKKFKEAQAVAKESEQCVIKLAQTEKFLRNCTR